MLLWWCFGASPGGYRLAKIGYLKRIRVKDQLIGAVEGWGVRLVWVGGDMGMVFVGVKFEKWVAVGIEINNPQNLILLGEWRCSDP